MNQKQKDLWVAALRSGDYKQGKGALRCKQDDTYCCLGVAQSVLKVRVRKNRYNQALSTVFLSIDHQAALMMMNDNDDRNFLEIADHIENYIPAKE